MNIQLAWKRVRKDIKEKHFISPLFMLNIIETDIEIWLKEIESEILANNLQLYPAIAIEIPKGNGLIRNGSLLTIENNILYAALVGESYNFISERISWTQNIIDFGYITSVTRSEETDWFENKMGGWSNFRTKSLSKLDQGYRYVLLTDISGFFDNIDISLLISDLKSCGVNTKIVSKLSECLNLWSTIGGKGIPQGNSSSDILAKLYLNVIDETLSNNNFIHLRYVDDIRVFCKTEIEAKKCIILLTSALKKRGLTIQSSKTKILTADEAYFEIDGIQPVLSDISKTYKTALEDVYNSEVYVADNSQQSAPIEIIKDAFNTHFVHRDGMHFNKTLFHFLINRLIQDKEGYALDYCLSLLVTHPEETEYILKYSKSFDYWDIEILGLDKKLVIKLIEFLSSDEAIYDYQNFLILSWLSTHIHNEMDLNLLKQIRIFAFDENKPYYLKSISKKILGSFGNSADLQMLEDSFNHATNHTHKAEIMCCLTRLEKTKRNGVLGRVSKDSLILGLAYKYLKSISD